MRGIYWQTMGPPADPPWPFWFPDTRALKSEPGVGVGGGGGGWNRGRKRSPRTNLFSRRPDANA